jgi:predicted transposase/invertase (TIGR01784 family)
MPTAKARQNHDTPWKKILRNYFPQAIQFFFPELAALIDWQRPPQFLDKEFEAIAPNADQGNRYVDKLVRVWLLDGRQEWLLIHLEVQGRKEKGFPLRMLTYAIRIFDRYGVLATSLAILCDTNATWRPTGCEVAAPLTQLDFNFGMVKLLDYKSDEVALAQSENPFAWIVLAHLKTQATQRHPKHRKAWKFALMRQLYERGLTARDIRNLYEFIDWTMMLPEGLETEFWQELKTFEEAQKVAYVTNAERIGRKIGLEEGEIKGEIKNAQKVALKLLQKGMAITEVAEVTELSIEQLQALQAKDTNKG